MYKETEAKEDMKEVGNIEGEVGDMNEIEEKGTKNITKKGENDNRGSEKEETEGEGTEK